MLVYSDGLRVNGSELTRGLASKLPPGVLVTGGLAGDGMDFKRTWVLHAGQPREFAVRDRDAVSDSGRAQPFVNLFDNGTWVLNVSVNGVPLTQLSATRTHTPVFLAAGANIISVANGSLSTDYYIRDGGSGSCILP